MSNPMEPHSERRPVAYLNDKFLNSPDARALRILSEFLEPLAHFRREKVRELSGFRVEPHQLAAVRLPDHEQLLAVFARQRIRQRQRARRQCNGLRFRVHKTALFRESPDLIFRLKYKVLAVGSPLAATLIRRIVPALKEALQIRSRRGYFPCELLPDGPGTLRSIESQVAAVGRPCHILDVALHSQQFSRVRSIRFGDEQIAKI